MKEKGRYIKYLPIVAMGLIILFFGAALRKISIDDILSLAPDNYLLSALLLLALYAIKSLSVVFPLLVLYISAGAMFPTPLALLVNTIGLLICITLPYLVGKLSGKEAVDRLVSRYPKAARLSEFSSQNSLFLSYLLRIVEVLPGDLVSMVLGASGISFGKYVVGSMLGLLPIMILAVFMGRSIQNPFSLSFLLPFLLVVALSFASLLIYQKVRKKK